MVLRKEGEPRHHHEKGVTDMKFNHVTLQVKDLDESVRFYTEVVGLEVKDKFGDGHGNDIVFVGSGETQVELISTTKDYTPGSGISLGFIPSSLEDAKALLSEKGFGAGGEVLSPNPHTHFFFVKDPAGYTVQFIVFD